MPREQGSYEYSCRRKIRYPEEVDARCAMPTHETYQCVYCNGWHTYAVGILIQRLRYPLEARSVQRANARYRRELRKRLHQQKRRRGK